MKRNILIVLLFTFNLLHASILNVSTIPGSPFATGATGADGVSYSPDGLFLAVANQTSNNVAVFSVNQVTGLLTIIPGSPFATGATGTVRVSYSPDGFFLAVSNQTSNNVTVFSVNQVTGFLTIIPGSPFATGGTVADGISYSPDGLFLSVANQTSNNVTVFSVNQVTGALSTIAGSPFSTGGGATGARELAYSPNGLFLSVSSTSNRVTAFTVNQVTGALTIVIVFGVGALPNGISYSPNGLFLGVSNITSNTIAFLSVNQVTGSLSTIPGSPLLTGGTNPDGTSYSPDGLFLAVSNTASNNVGVFSVNQVTGLLTTMPGSPFATGGTGARGLAYSPNGLFMAVANQTSNNVTVFRVCFTEVGSDTQVELFNVQPIICDLGRIATFAALSAGFKLENSIATAIFDSVFPVGGNIDLMGGALELDSDLVLKNVSQLNTLGDIVGNNHVLNLAKNISLVPAISSSQCFEWGNLQVCLNSNIILEDCCITFTGNSTLDGRGNCLTIKPTCTIRIAPNASLLMKNIIIQGVQTGRIVPLDSTSTLSLKNVEWVLEQNYSFTQGHFDVLKQFKISGRNRAFSYESDQVSTIGKNATLQLDAAVTFSYQPPTGEDRIQLLDTTSTLFLKGATLHASNVGLQLERGVLQVDRESFLSSDGTKFTTGIKLGDGAIAANNISLAILPAAQLKIASGFVVENDA